MPAGKYSFVIEQGATVSFELQYKDATNTPVDLSGYSAKMQIRSDYNDNSPVTYLTLSSSLQPDGTGLNLSGSSGNTPVQSGSIGLYISAATSSMLTFETAKYDLELTVNNEVTRLLEGQVRISKQVTN